MPKQFIACAPANFLKGRRGFRPEAIVLHGMSSLERARELFTDPASALSAHYVVGAEGNVLQFVEESDSAFHAGIVVNPSWRGLRPGVNPNFYTLGVAFAGAWNDRLRDRLAQLLAEVASRWSITLDAGHLPLHTEIRASKPCPGAGFDRAGLLQRLQALAAGAVDGAASPIHRRPGFVHLRTQANLREGAPRTTARIVRTLAAGDDLEVIGFTERGERVRDNSVWYQTTDNNFLWAGSTDAPQPALEEILAPAAPPAPLLAPTPASATTATTVASGTLSGIAGIDGLLSGRMRDPIGPDNADRATVGALQDLLTGQGQRGLPGILSSQYGLFGRATAGALRAFQTAQQLPISQAADAVTLRSLIATPAIDPRITQIYLTLVLHTPFQGMHKVLAITAQMEGVGKFGALNLNTDRAGLSFGLIQWAQRPGRLPELLRAFRAADPSRFSEIFGNGDAALADALIRHVAKPNGGVHPRTGITADPAFDLVEEPWVGRFRQAARHLPFQQAQLGVALQAFTGSYRTLRAYASQIRSERGAAFMLDVANQFGDGGLRRLYNEVHRPGMNELDLMEAIAEETVEEMPDAFQQGVRARREGFLRTALLSDQPIDLLATPAGG